VLPELHLMELVLEYLLQAIDGVCSVAEDPLRLYVFMSKRPKGHRES
jgi:hypothetical protein